MILACAMLTVLLILAIGIVSYGCSELIATRTRNDLLVSAYYVAISGCERMYADLKATATPAWGVPTGGNISIGPNIIGTYSATHYQASASEFYIVSTGTVRGHTAKATVKLGYLVDYSGPLAMGAYGAVTLNGSSNQAKIMMQGPVASSTSTPIILGRTDISGTPQTIANTGTPRVSFFDTPNAIINPSVLTELKAADANSDGTVTLIEAQDALIEDHYNTVNTYTPSDGVTEKDAFYYYYTTYLNNPLNNPLGQTLNIGAGESRYYTGDQTFGTSSIPNSVKIIFVNGNATINNNDGATTDHTVVVTGNLTLQQPNNSPGSRNTYIVFGNVATDGEMGNSGGTKGDLIIFANGNIDKQGGGKMNASFFANGTLNLDTAGDTGKKHLMFSRLTESWDGGNAPLGVPVNYPLNITSGFSVKNQTNYPAVWQRE